MKKSTRILIAYDGSDCADAALNDLKAAGLPETTEALVLSVADVFVPPPLDEPMYIPESVKRAHKHAESKLEEAGKLAAEAVKKIKNSFPHWQVTHLAQADSPAWAILREAGNWNADLIVVGAQGHAVFGGRLILGSISQRVLYEANCSVRIARSRAVDKNDLHLLIGVDNSPYSDAAVEAVCNRTWPKGTEVRLLAVVDTVMAVTPDSSESAAQKWIEVDDERKWDEITRLFGPEAGKLRAAGLTTEIVIRRGNPADKILEEAEVWGADCIFLGPKGSRGINRLLLGSVSSAVASRATSSVEIVRKRTEATP